MTDDDGYDENAPDDNDDSDREVRLKRSQIRTLERDAKTARQQAEENAALKRELAFTRAKLPDLTERQQKALFASIDGDITAESVRTTAEELGFVQPAADTSQGEERRQMDQMAQASSGSADASNEDRVARLHRAAAEGGREAVLAQLQADGAQIVTAS